MPLLVRNIVFSFRFPTIAVSKETTGGIFKEHKPWNARSGTRNVSRCVITHTIMGVSSETECEAPGKMFPRISPKLCLLKFRRDSRNLAMHRRNDVQQASLSVQPFALNVGRPLYIPLFQDVSRMHTFSYRQRGMLPARPSHAVHACQQKESFQAFLAILKIPYFTFIVCAHQKVSTHSWGYLNSNPTATAVARQ